MKEYASLIIGETALDTNVDYDGSVVHAVGGAVYYSGYAAATWAIALAGTAVAVTSRDDGRSEMMEHLEMAIEVADDQDRETIRRFMRQLENA